MSERELQRKAEIAELLLHAARRLGESLEPERVYERFRELLSDVVEHDGVVVSSYDETDGLIRCDYAWSDGELLDPSRLPPLPLNREGGMQSRVIVSGEPLLVGDVGELIRTADGTYYDVDREGTMRKLPESGPPGTQAAMMVPVKEEGRVVGVVQLMSDRERYRPEQLEVLEGLVSQMAVALRHARLQKERRRLEAVQAAALAVAAERERAAHVLEAVGDGIFLVDDDGVVRLWNRAAAVATGVAAADALGSPVADAFRGWDALAERIPVTEGGAPARAVALPVEVTGGDVWLSFVAVRSADGVVYAFRDVTAEQRLEEEKSDFIATISHELRTPMAGVYGAAETLLHRREELEPEQVRQLVEMIASQAARLSQVTDDVLLASQLDRDELRVEHAPVDVAALVHASVAALRQQLPESASIAVDVAPRLASAEGDADRVQQVLVNLLDNAVKYGGGRVHVRVDADDSSVCVVVADEGAGVAPADRERIFEKFYRAGDALTRAQGGSGLGLYISRELALRMGGALDVRSEPGSGSEFTLRLPRLRG